MLPNESESDSSRIEKTPIEFIIENKRDIDQIRKDVEQLMRTDLNLSHKQDLMVQKLDAMRERLDEGVSKTAWHTKNKVEEMFLVLKDIQHYNENQDRRIDELGHEFESYKKVNDKIVGRFSTGIYWVAFIGLGGGLIALLFRFLTSSKGFWFG